jgi:hypothetical protein
LPTFQRSLLAARRYNPEDSHLPNQSTLRYLQLESGVRVAVITIHPRMSHLVSNMQAYHSHCVRNVELIFLKCNVVYGVGSIFFVFRWFQQTKRLETIDRIPQPQIVLPVLYVSLRAG